MEKKILLQELAERLAANRKISKKQAESFVKCFFEVAEEALLRDKFVKIKGFGTFKVVSVSERESVSVNTGERIQISGHAKVAFTPDTLLRDLVNRPFSHFETIILNDDTDIDEFDKVQEEDIISTIPAMNQDETKKLPMPGGEVKEVPEIQEVQDAPEELRIKSLPKTEIEIEIETETAAIIDEAGFCEQSNTHQPETESEVEVKSETEVEATPVESKTEAEPDVEVKTEAEPNVEFKAEIEPEVEVKSETEVDAAPIEPVETNEYEEAIEARAAHTRRVILWSIATLLLMAGSFAIGHYHWLLPCPHTTWATTDSTAVFSQASDSTTAIDTLSPEKPAMQSASPKSVESAPDSPMESAPKERLLPSAPQTAPAAP